ncbi:hypothetical protein BHE74_00053837 [Ensete ventricosum]|uniref:Uncharacterized protein n=1 Tax=Ensete ventricosum TaxID=4639 RepID=A0A444GHD4_ENSVE|nr:hypothetical protein B296_00014798 [Ensete ventricosum]RWW34282.1 hypothetical protein GW17_00000957 [Ensete ventricosum]RWW40729.1 hypothetical protein BHE74_00053837 [Ensete ventricosum]
MAGSATLASVSLFVFLLGFAQCKTVKRDGTSCTVCCIHFKIWVALPPESSVLVVVTELEVYAVSIVGPFPIAVTNLLDLTRL